jgi:hypothetical protein
VDEECDTVITQAWNSTAHGCNSMEMTKLKLEQCQKQLLEWSKQKFGVGNRYLRSLE